MTIGNQKIKFGTKQFNNPTPSKIGRVLKVFVAIAGVFIGWIGTVDYISSYHAKVTQSIVGLLIGVAVALEPFFGVENVPKNVPREDVTEIDTK